MNKLQKSLAFKCIGHMEGAPLMYATTNKAFAAYLEGIIWMCGYEGPPLAPKFFETNGPVYVDLTDTLTEKKALEMCLTARDILFQMENPIMAL